MRKIMALLTITLLMGQCVLAEQLELAGADVLVRVDQETGTWSLLDKRAGVSWPAEGEAAAGLPGPFTHVTKEPARIRLANDQGTAVTFALVEDGRTLELSYEGARTGDLSLIGDALIVTDRGHGSLIVPCREGLLIPADSGVAFKHSFGSSEYEGCHMNMIGLLDRGAALVASWDGVNVWADVSSTITPDQPSKQTIRTTLRLKSPAKTVRLTPLGKGDWNTIASGYRQIAERKGLAATLTSKEKRNEHLNLLEGAANVKLWTCLNRRMNEESTQEEHVEVQWTFDEAAQIAAHLKNDLKIDRCLFTIGGWTEGGYDCRHPDNLPANPECGGNAALADAVKRIQALGYVACFHDNYQDMYRDAKSWSPDVIEKKPDGSLISGGRWLGGRAFMVCAPKQLEMAMRPQNLPEIQKLFGPWSYFIDTTYAVGPRECADPRHPLSRDDDVAWKSKMSDYARDKFGLFGSECGREWALPHSDFFEGLTGVSGKYFHQLDPKTLGAKVIPFWEMVYHDCEVCYGKYGYRADRAAEYVAQHVLIAHPLNYHSIPKHIYWKDAFEPARSNDPLASYTRSDDGWATGLHPTDVFLKNTQEVLGPLNRMTAHERLTSLEFLTPDGHVRQATYGTGERATVVRVNLGGEKTSVVINSDGKVDLPPWGFVIESPRFVAFYALNWDGVDYPEGALFTIQSEGDESLAHAKQARVFHACGNPRLHWRGKDFEVRREEMVSLGN